MDYQIAFWREEEASLIDALARKWGQHDTDEEIFLIRCAALAASMYRRACDVMDAGDAYSGEVL